VVINKLYGLANWLGQCLLFTGPDNAYNKFATPVSKLL